MMSELSSTYILFPALALAFWTFCILLLIPIRRTQAIRSKSIRLSDFRLGESERVPESVRLANRNYMNLLELPMLFYVFSVLSYVTHSVSQSMVWLACLYTITRIIHSLVHVTYNKVMHRFFIFGLSNMILMILWGQLGMALLDKPL